jgi:hypothetical protein
VRVVYHKKTRSTIQNLISENLLQNVQISLGIGLFRRLLQTPPGLQFKNTPTTAAIASAMPNKDPIAIPAMAPAVSVVEEDISSKIAVVCDELCDAESICDAMSDGGMLRGKLPGVESSGDNCDELPLAALLLEEVKVDEAPCSRVRTGVREFDREGDGVSEDWAEELAVRV